MLLTIAFILVVLWFVGFIVFHMAGFFIHILLIVAVISVLLRIIGWK